MEEEEHSIEVSEDSDKELLLTLVKDLLEMISIQIKATKTWSSSQNYYQEQENVYNYRQEPTNHPETSTDIDGGAEIEDNEYFMEA